MAPLRVVDTSAWIEWLTGTADAIVHATARQHRAELLTCDAHFKDLPNVALTEQSSY